MDDRTLRRTGVAAIGVAALCCATPALVVVLGAAGLSAWIGWTVLIPALVVFLGITAYVLKRRRADAVCRAVPGHAEAGTPGECR